MRAGRVERVVLVGRDAALWLTALAIARALGRTGVTVEAVELPSQLSAADVYTALPSIRALHRLIGLEEPALYSLCGAVPSLGQRFEHWSGTGSAFVHAYDIQRPAIQDVDFLQYWVKARGEGLRVPLEDFSLAAAAAKQGRMSDAPGDGERLSGFQPGYQIDARPYAALIREAAQRSGVAVRRAALAGVERSGDRIDAILLDDGARLEADLFIDASGAEAALIGGAPGAVRTSWGRWLPCDRIIRASGPPLRPLPGFANVAAGDLGWIGLYPLQGRTALVAAVEAGSLSDDEAVAQVAASAGIGISGERVVAPMEQGALERPWIGNCVSVGASAATIEPLDAGALHIVQTGLSTLIALWPVDRVAMPEAQAYNDLLRSHLTNLRDFTVAHYALSRRNGPFWQAARAAASPETLEPKTRLFASRGKVVLYDDETFQAQSWSALFAGHGLIPASYDPLVDKVSPEEQMQSFRRLLQVIAQEVQAMPTVEAFIAARRHRQGR